MTYYLVYKTTNLINGKFYIGKHQTEDLNDGYMGSGNVLKRAIKKYGEDNFTTEILEVYDKKWKMELAERILVVVDKEVSYNLKRGGNGGFDYLNEVYWTEEKRKEKQQKIREKNGPSIIEKMSIEDRKKYGMRGAVALINRRNNDPIFAAYVSRKNQETQTKRLEKGIHHFQNSQLQSDLCKRGLKKQKELGLGFYNKEWQKLHSPSNVEWECPHCGKIGKGLANKSRWHFDKCKMRHR